MTTAAIAPERTAYIDGALMALRAIDISGDEFRIGVDVVNAEAEKRWPRPLRVVSLGGSTEYRFSPALGDIECRTANGGPAWVQSMAYSAAERARVKRELAALDDLIANPYADTAP